MLSGKIANFIRMFLLIICWSLIIFLTFFSLEGGSHPTTYGYVFLGIIYPILIFSTIKLRKINRLSRISPPQIEQSSMVNIEQAKDYSPNIRIKKDVNTIILFAPITLFIIICILFYGFRSSALMVALVPLEVEIGPFPLILVAVLEMLAVIVVILRKVLAEDQ